MIKKNYFVTIMSTELHESDWYSVYISQFVLNAFMLYLYTFNRCFIIVLLYCLVKFNFE